MPETFGSTIFKLPQNISTRQKILGWNGSKMQIPEAGCAWGWEADAFRGVALSSEAAPWRDVRYPSFQLYPRLPGINIGSICNIPEDGKGRFTELFLLILAILNFPTLTLSKAINVIDTKLLTFNGSHHAWNTDHGCWEIREGTWGTAPMSKEGSSPKMTHSWSTGRVKKVTVQDSFKTETTVIQNTRMCPMA